MVLVVGSTGLLGSEICLRLRSAGKPVRAMVRRTSPPEKIAALREAGVNTVVADLKDPRSLAEACNSVSAIVSTASSTFSRQEDDSIKSVDHVGYLNLIEAAAKAGIGHFVYTSIPRNLNYDSPLVSAKRQVESRLAASGVPYTVLNANYFMEIWLSTALGFDHKNGCATIYGAGQQPIAWVSYHDVAALAVAALDRDSMRNRMLDAGGPDNLTPLEVVEVFTRLDNRRFKITHVPEEDLRNQYERADDALAKSFAGLMLEYAAGCPMDSTEALAALPCGPRTVREYALEVTSEK